MLHAGLVCSKIRVFVSSCDICSSVTLTPFSGLHHSGLDAFSLLSPPNVLTVLSLSVKFLQESSVFLISFVFDRSSGPAF